MVTSSNGNIFRVTGALCGNSLVTGEFLSHRPVLRSFDNLRLNKRLSKQSRRQWFETTSRSLWRHCNAHSLCVFVVGDVLVFFVSIATEAPSNVSVIPTVMNSASTTVSTTLMNNASTTVSTTLMNNASTTVSTTLPSGFLSRKLYTLKEVTGGPIHYEGTALLVEGLPL